LLIIYINAKYFFLRITIKKSLKNKTQKKRAAVDLIFKSANKSMNYNQSGRSNVGNELEMSSLTFDVDDTWVCKHIYIILNISVFKLQRNASQNNW